MSQPQVAPLRWPTLCLITDRTLVGADSLPAVAAEAAAGGVTMVQLREKDLPTRELLHLAERLRARLEPSVALLINGRVDVARAAGADGAHLPGNGLPVEAARLVLGRTALVGQSVHDRAALDHAARADADYVELGTIFPSRSHPGGRTLGLPGLQAITQDRDVAVLAIGGITAENAAEVMLAGADGIAVISAILAAREPGRAAEALARQVHAGYAARVGQEPALCS